VRVKKSSRRADYRQPQGFAASRKTNASRKASPPAARLRSDSAHQRQQQQQEDDDARAEADCKLQAHH
jgi:hypothetical protein